MMHATDIPTDATTAEVTFYPEEWVPGMDGDDHARITGDKITRFEIPLEDALDDDGDLITDLTDKAARLADHEDAPDWIQTWTGPYEVGVAVVR